MVTEIGTSFLFLKPKLVHMQVRFLVLFRAPWEIVIHTYPQKPNWKPRVEIQELRWRIPAWKHLKISWSRKDFNQKKCIFNGCPWLALVYALSKSNRHKTHFFRVKLSSTDALWLFNTAMENDLMDDLAVFTYQKWWTSPVRKPLNHLRHATATYRNAPGTASCHCVRPARDTNGVSSCAVQLHPRTGTGEKPMTKTQIPLQDGAPVRER